MKSLYPLLLLILSSCSQISEKNQSVQCSQSGINDTVITLISPLDSSFTFKAPKFWATEFVQNRGSRDVHTSDTAKQLEEAVIFSKAEFTLPAQQLSEFIQTAYAYLEDRGIQFIDSGSFKSKGSLVHWIKYSDPTNTFSHTNTNLEFFYSSLNSNNITTCKIVAHGPNNVEERLCSGYQIYLANE